ncbi:MAG: flagellar basal body P-ring protein FlgI [Gammaproteobacteria bacterium]|nr:flagellar basal body P-ring protein FlgI [Gammaproteobacteria bacterium]
MMLNLRKLMLMGLLAVSSNAVFADRVKDLAAVAGVRDNQLVGYGLIVGLNGTGDQTSQTPFTVQSLKNMLNQFGISVPPNVKPQLKNVAAVSLSATLPAFAKPGQKIDITASSIGNAKSLRGGTLLMAPLRGADGQVYAIAQGNLVVSGLTAGGEDGSKVTVNIPSVGRIPNGATVERAVANPFMSGDHLVLNLHAADFTTANRLAESINTTMGPGTALPIDATSVQVNAPRDAGQRVAYVSMLENLELVPGDAPARVVVNSRTGTVVIGSHVRILPAAVAHGNLVVTVTEDVQVSQPDAFSSGRTAVTPSSSIDISEEPSHMFLVKEGITLNDIVVGVNRVGAAPSDLVAILEALKEAGALRAELIIL